MKWLHDAAAIHLPRIQVLPAVNQLVTDTPLLSSNSIEANSTLGQTNPIGELTARMNTIKLNELVLKPETFDGINPQPRKWIDDYEKAAKTNNWTDEITTKYFPTFLNKSAYDWYVAIALRKLGAR